MKKATLTEAHCSHCGVLFGVQPEPAPGWERGLVRLTKKLSGPEMHAYRWLEGMPCSHYLCGRCYFDAVLPVVQEAA